jgi:hypothetical protein
VELSVVSKNPGGLIETVPSGDLVTDYDRAHLQLYIRLLDARSAGTSSDDMCRLILEIDPTSDRDRAQKLLASHLERADWMSSVGFRQI